MGSRDYVPTFWDGKKKFLSISFIVRQIHKKNFQAHAVAFGNFATPFFVLLFPFIILVFIT